MTGKQNAPEIRFEGFADPWEQRKFSDVAVIRRGLTYSPTNIVDGADGVRVLRSANINEDHFVLNDDDVFVDEGAVNIDLVHDGDILITAANGSPRLVGKRARISDLPGKTVHGGFMLVASSPYSDFLCASMGSSWYRRFLATGVAGGNGAIGNLDSKALGETTIAVPNDAEIDKLGNFFTRLDSLITLHQRKYDKLCTVKKSMLDKMFPKPGETEPEIRFEGFTDPWEQRKLNECLTVSSEKNSNGAFKRNDVLSVSKDFGVINQIAFQGRSFAGADLSNYGVLNHGEIVYTKSPLKDNPFGIIKSNKSRSGIVSTLYAIYRPLDGTLANFIDCYFSQDARVNNYLHPLISKGAKNDMKVSAENALKGTISIPSVAEQKMICELLAQLDSLITLHQRKLELLRNIKKSLLDRMFV